MGTLEKVPHNRFHLALAHAVGHRLTFAAVMRKLYRRLDPELVAARKLLDTLAQPQVDSQ